MPGHPVGAARPDIDPVGAPRGCRRSRARIELTAERFPGMPRAPVPIPVPQLTVAEHREDLELIFAPGRCAGRGRERPAKGFGVIPGAVAPGPVDEPAGRVRPEEIDPPGPRGDRSRAIHDRVVLPREGYSVWASERPRSSATHSSSRRTAAAVTRLVSARTS